MCGTSAEPALLSLALHIVGSFCTLLWSSSNTSRPFLIVTILSARASSVMGVESACMGKGGSGVSRNALTGSSRFWSGAGITGIGTEGGGTLCGDSMKGVECCGENAGAVAGMFACMNHSMGGYAWTSSGSCRIGSEVA